MVSHSTSLGQFVHLKNEENFLFCLRVVKMEEKADEKEKMLIRSKGAEVFSSDSESGSHLGAMCAMMYLGWRPQWHGCKTQGHPKMI